MRNRFIIIFILSGIVLGLTLFFNYSTVSIHDSEQQDDQYMSNYNVYALKVPDRMKFAGEEVPLDRWDVKESLDRELLVNTYWQSQTILFIKRANRYFAILEPILREHGVPDDFKYLALIESGFEPTIVSPAGAAGIWQFMKGTARDYKLEVNSEVDERYNIEKATHAACEYLKDSYKKFGSWTLVAASYNAGRRHIQKQLSLQNAGSLYDLLLGEETSRYLFRILAVKSNLENPQAYGFHVKKEDLYPHIPTHKVEVNSRVEDFALFARQHGVNYKILKIFNPWLRKPYLTNKRKKKYFITIPEKGYCNFVFSEYDHLKDDSLNSNKGY